MMRGIVDVFAAYERDVIRARTRAALGVKKARGERVGEVAYGFRVAVDGVRLEHDEAEQGVLAVVRELRAAGLSQRAIASALTERGLLSRSGKPFGSARNGSAWGLRGGGTWAALGGRAGGKWPKESGMSQTKSQARGRGPNEELHCAVKIVWVAFKTQREDARALAQAIVRFDPRAVVSG